MEQVAGDFFLELNILASNYGGCLIIPYIYGAFLNFVENLFYDAKKGAFEASCRELAAKVASTTARCSLEIAARDALRERKNLTFDEQFDRELLTRDCAVMTEQLAQFERIKVALFEEARVEEGKHFTRNKAILGVTVTGLLVTGAVWIFKAAKHALVEYIKA